MVYAIAPVRTVAPSSEPVSLAEAKDHLRVTHDLENTLIAAYVSAAVSHLDGWAGILGRCIVTQTWRQDLDGFPVNFRLPFPDVQSVTVAYTDTAGQPQTVDAATYHIVNRVNGGALLLATGAAWPSVYDRPDAVRVAMVCGFATVPPAIKAAILLHVGELYANRTLEGSDAEYGYQALIKPFRRVGL